RNPVSLKRFRKTMRPLKFPVPPEDVAGHSGGKPVTDEPVTAMLPEPAVRDGYRGVVKTRLACTDCEMAREPWWPDTLEVKSSVNDTHRTAWSASIWTARFWDVASDSSVGMKSIAVTSCWHRVWSARRAFFTMLSKSAWIS